MTEDRCNWYRGCDQESDPETDGLCAFHFDACERTEHAQAQRAYEERVVTEASRLEAEVQKDEENWTRAFGLTNPIDAFAGDVQ
jgi:hypothetical protein